MYIQDKWNPREKLIINYGFRVDDTIGENDIREDILSFVWHCFSPIHVEHPEWRLGEITDWNGKALNRAAIRLEKRSVRRPG